MYIYTERERERDLHSYVRRLIRRLSLASIRLMGALKAPESISDVFFASTLLMCALKALESILLFSTLYVYVHIRMYTYNYMCIYIYM